MNPIDQDDFGISSGILSFEQMSWTRVWPLISILQENRSLSFGT